MHAVLAVYVCVLRAALAPHWLTAAAAPGRASRPCWGRWCRSWKTSSCAEMQCRSAPPTRPAGAACSRAGVRAARHRCPATLSQSAPRARSCHTGLGWQGSRRCASIDIQIFPSDQSRCLKTWLYTSTQSTCQTFQNCEGTSGANTPLTETPHQRQSPPSPPAPQPLASPPLAGRTLQVVSSAWENRQESVRRPLAVCFAHQAQSPQPRSCERRNRGVGTAHSWATTASTLRNPVRCGER
mmetsp:Transcript_1799/g.4086  ORF Transcript_1799/g.4086 Transcript_1799/m.4086 type:complete len:240 (+) Transcript_1799:1592-2311(+)